MWNQNRDHNIGPRTELKLSNLTYFNATLNEYTTEEMYCPTLVATDIRKNPTYSRDYVLIANSAALVFIPMLVNTTPAESRVTR
jgi:hypothetical protein